jgi:hypothetical protein
MATFIEWINCLSNHSVITATITADTATTDAKSGPYVKIVENVSLSNLLHAIKHSVSVKFGVLRVVNIGIMVCWDIMPCSLLDISAFQRNAVPLSSAWKIKVETGSLFEMLVPSYQFT